MLPVISFSDTFYLIVLKHVFFHPAYMPARYKPPCLQADPKPLMKLYNPMGFYGTTKLIYSKLLPSWETQGQLVGAGKIYPGEKKFWQRKVKNEKKSSSLLDFSGSH